LWRNKTVYNLKRSEDMQIKIILERGEDSLFARTEPAVGGFFAVAEGENETQAVAEMRGLIDDYLQHEGKTDAVWQGIISSNDTVFEVFYDLQAFFDTFKALKITEIAHLANLSGSLVRQYVAGTKHPSAKQAQKIEDAVHLLGKRLLAVSVC
jgi:hypothetical protein